MLQFVASLTLFLQPLVDLSAEFNEFVFLKIWTAPYIAILVLHAARAAGVLDTSVCRRLGTSLRRASPLWLQRTFSWLFQHNFGLVLHVYRLAVIAATGTGLLIPRVALADTSVVVRRWCILVIRSFFMLAERYDLYATLLVLALVDCPAWYTVYVKAGMPDALSIVLWNGIAAALPRVVLEFFRPIAGSGADAFEADGVGDGAKQTDVKSRAKASPLGSCGSDGKAKFE